MKNYPIVLLITLSLFLKICAIAANVKGDILSCKEKNSKTEDSGHLVLKKEGEPLVNTFVMVNDSAKKDKGQKYLKVISVSMNLEKDDTLMIFYKNEESWLAKNIMSVEFFKANVKFDQTEYINSLIKYLKKYSHDDTREESIFPDYQNANYIEAVIEKVKLYHIGSTKNNKGKGMSVDSVYAETQIKWIILDYYNVKQDSITLTVNSKHFDVSNLPSDLYDLYDIVYIKSENKEHEPEIIRANYIPVKVPGIINAIDNSVELSLVKLLENVKFKKLTDRTSDANKYTSFKLKCNRYESKTLNDLIQAAVTIKTGKDSHCSGFLISEDGYIVTTYHNFANNKNKITVILNSGAKYEAKIERISPMCDLALLKIDGSMLPHMQIKTYDVKDVQLGSDVTTIGTPTSVELGQSIAKGTISGTRKPGNITYIQTSVAVNAGSSGGAILNDKGEVLGVVTSKLYGIGIEGIAFVIPSNYIFEELKLEY